MDQPTSPPLSSTRQLPGKTNDLYILLYQLLETRDLTEENHPISFVIHTTTIMPQPIAHDQIIGLQYAIVTLDLIEHLLRDGHLRRLVLHDDSRSSPFACKEHRVTTPPHTTDIESYFIRQQTGGVVTLGNKIMHEVLPHPLFGSQRHIPPAKHIPHRRPAISSGTRSQRDRR